MDTLIQKFRILLHILVRCCTLLVHSPGYIFCLVYQAKMSLTLQKNEGSEAYDILLYSLAYSYILLTLYTLVHSCTLLDTLALFCTLLDTLGYSWILLHALVDS